MTFEHNYDYTIIEILDPDDPARVVGIVNTNAEAEGLHVLSLIPKGYPARVTRPRPHAQFSVLPWH